MAGPTLSFILLRTSFLYLFLLFSSLSCDTTDSDHSNYIGDPTDLKIDYDPAWSLDGNAIAYVHLDSIDSKSGLYLINPFTDSTIQLLQGFFITPSWSPDGNWIAFTNLSDKLIYKVFKDGTLLTKLSQSPPNFCPSWSRDGKWIVFYSTKLNPYTDLLHILRMLSNGTGEEVLASNPFVGDITSPWYSYDSKFITHVRWIDSHLASEIYLMDSSGRNEKRITFNNGIEYDPRLNPSGDLILFTFAYPYRKIRVCTIDTSGQNFRDLVDFNSSGGEWSPDGEQIVFTDLREGHLWLMGIEGTVIKQLTF